MDQSGIGDAGLRLGRVIWDWGQNNLGLERDQSGAGGTDLGLGRLD